MEIIKYLSFAEPNLHFLLFVHGGSHAAWCWEKNFLPFFSAKGYSSYALSFRGHGKSEGYEELHSFTLEDYAEDVLQVIGTLKEKPVLIGHSMGGAVVQKIMHTYPQRVKAAVLMSSVPPEGMLMEVKRMVNDNLNEAGKIFSFNRKSDGGLPVELFLPLNISDSQKAEYLRHMQPESQKASKELIKRIVPEFSSCKLPILVLGSKKDRIFTEATAREIGETYGVTPIIFEDVSHDMMLDSNWITVAEQINFFLRESVL